MGMSWFIGVPTEAGFVPLLPLRLAMKKYHRVTGLQLVPLGIWNPECVRGRSSALGPLSWLWQKGQMLWSDAEASWSEPLHVSICVEPPDPTPTLSDQEVTRWPEMGRVLSCIAPGNLPALSAAVHLHGAMGAQEVRCLGFWFSVTKAVVLGIFSTAECFVCALTAFAGQRKNKKLRSKHGDINILTQWDFTSLRSYAPNSSSGGGRRAGQALNTLI